MPVYEGIGDFYVAVHAKSLAQHVLSVPKEYCTQKIWAIAMKSIVIKVFKVVSVSYCCDDKETKSASTLCNVNMNNGSWNCWTARQGVSRCKIPGQDCCCPVLS